MFHLRIPQTIPCQLDLGLVGQTLLSECDLGHN